MGAAKGGVMHYSSLDYRFLRAFVIACFVSGFLLPVITSAPARAQQADAQGGVLEEILVTARKREENVLEIAESISA